MYIEKSMDQLRTTNLKNLWFRYSVSSRTWGNGWIWWNKANLMFLWNETFKLKRISLFLKEWGTKSACSDFPTVVVDDRGLDFTPPISYSFSRNVGHKRCFSRFLSLWFLFQKNLINIVQVTFPWKMVNMFY